ncbi:hypothetical protein HYFRA_00007524 [Hymenoscyphus fraxineus]|uniref:2,6-dihydroxypyridine 3-monooxygenase substrate binding domain-containing protein n=1 Tax=Hymenoscyphus fraxineus TaxID=746836 RepID=A0A9N9KSM1_9HELO|nr:hypothetical protein HYFRA_00007524 [Hymenoscyphus fraxineus]
MVNNPLNVVIVGGSLTALFHGIVLQRLGHRVRILERNPSNSQISYGAGIAAMEHVQAFLSQHDKSRTDYSVTSPNVQFLDSSNKIKSTWNVSLQMTSWKVLYYMMRANFDGMASDICPEPPKQTALPGFTSYEHSKNVTEVKYIDGLVSVIVEDVDNFSYETVHADLVLAADGASSTLRQLLQPNLKNKYAGYVAWRGTALESEISDKTKAIFACKTTFFTHKVGYIVLYTIPGEDGSTSPGSRQMNWVWYTLCPESSDEFAEVMTDVDGHRHHTTLPIGMIDPEKWEQQKALAGEILPEPFAEVVQRTTRPFISAIHDRETANPSFFDGKLLFVGDSLATFRPHIASSTNQAALDASLVGQLMNGEIDISKWEESVLAFANFAVLRSQLWGAYYLSGILSVTFAVAFFRYWKLFLVQSVCKRCFG